MKFAGLDIGGANIKFVSGQGECNQIAFPFWTDKDLLPKILTGIAASFTTPTCLGVTMTAELADCFPSKQEGVAFIVNAVENTLGDYRPLYYQTDGGMCDAMSAIKNWQTVAASNWHALAWFAFSDCNERSGFVFDIGSTTTDIIPVENGLPVIQGQNDLSRLLNHQLFYAGVERTPICSLIDEVELESGTASVARELFATALDVFLWLGEIEPSETLSTADGRPATRIHAGNRLARMVCADFDELRPQGIDAVARQTRDKLKTHLSHCLSSVVAEHPTLPLTFKTFGGGTWLAEEVVRQTFSSSPDANAKVISFSHDETTNQTAAALAVAKKRALVFAENAVKENAH